jgi:hypothetical protein
LNISYTYLAPLGFVIDQLGGKKNNLTQTTILALALKPINTNFVNQLYSQTIQVYDYGKRDYF